MTEGIHFREGDRADRDGILALRKLAFPDEDVEKQRPSYWDWEFVAGYAGPGRVFVAECGGRIVAHFAFVPQRYRTSAGDAAGALAVDVMTDPAHRRQGVFSELARFAAARLRSDFDLVLAFQIRKAVLGGMVAGGWRPVASAPVVLRPLSIVNVIRDLARGADGSASIIEPSSADVRPLTVRELAPLADGFRGTGQPRTPAFLDWRYSSNPHSPYAMEGWFAGSELRAFLVHRPAVLKGMSTLAIVDGGARHGDDESLRELIADVCRRARRSVALAAALVSTSHPLHRALRRSGFFAGPHRFNVLAQAFNARFEQVLHEPWSLSWGDTDHL